ncbi:putative Zn-dependent protease [Granulicella aggregans]|uniref:Putative Zn-dependent protease n=1 Tax=Granulicella aggregans TaxID=474949 RepID=A0A7W7ZG54_9BACT|nr:putative Zn-dependent protease [Granulicella aggregans]
MSIARRLIFLAVVSFLTASFETAQATPQTEVERLYATAQKAMLAGRMDEARSDYEKLAKLAPTIAEVHASLGAIEFQQKFFPEALRELNEARRLKPSLPGLDGLIAMSLTELGHFEEALPALEATYKEADNPQVKRISGLELERAYMGVHREADAVEVALALQKQFPNDPEILYHNERIFGSFAYLTVQKLVEVAPNSTWRHQAQAEAQEAAGAHDAAIAEYRAILAIDPNRAGIHYRIGRAYRASARDSHRSGDLDHAMDEFQAELKIDRQNASALYELGELHRIAGEAEPARTFFAAALKVYPDFPEAELGLGTVLATLQRPAEALPYLTSASQHDPDDEATWYRLSQVQRTLGHTAEAKDALARFQALRGQTLAQQASPRDVTRQELEPSATQ